MILMVAIEGVSMLSRGSVPPDSSSSSVIVTVKLWLPSKAASSMIVISAQAVSFSTAPTGKVTSRGSGAE